MPDREKVINELVEHIESALSVDSDYVDYVRTDLLQYTVALLKEQEPMLLENQHKPYGISTNANSPWISRCPRCGKKVEGKQTKFCKYCGQAVKWDE